jgi:trigger factor
LNVQTELLENHTARLTVTIEPDQMEQAKQKAAQKLSKRFRIPGFRPGKAPYKKVLSYVGEAAVLEEALESLGDNIYKTALTESAVKPYGPGSLEEFKDNPATFVFSVPLQPEVELNDYRSVRVDYKPGELTDEEFERGMKDIQQREALVEESHQPAIKGNRVTVDIHSQFTDGAEPPEPRASSHHHDHEHDHDHEHGDEHDHEHDHEHHDHEHGDEHDHEHGDEHDHDHEDEPAEIAAEAPQVEINGEETPAEETPAADPNVIYKGDEFIHRHDHPVNITDDEDPLLLPGFAEKLIGANPGDDVKFELEVPDRENYKDIVGRKVEFDVKVKKVEVVTLPEMNDDFAARLTKDEEEPLTLLQLRMRVRENMQKDVRQKADEAYADDVLNQIIAQAKVAYPDMMVADRIEEILKDLDENLRQQGLNLEYYQKATGLTKERLYEMYQPQAETSLTRSLVMGEVMNTEKIMITPEELTRRTEELLETLPKESRDSFRSFLATPAQQSRLLNNLLYERVRERLVQMGKGEAPELTEGDALPQIETVSAAAEPVEAPAPEASTETVAESASGETVSESSPQNE